MVHIGRFYKLQFRRDLANVDQNNSAYAECYGLAMGPLAGSLGNTISNHVYQLVNLLKDDQPPMVWLNESIVIGGTLLRMRAVATNPFDSNQTSWRFEVDDILSGVNLFSIEPLTRPNQNNFSSWDLLDAVPLHQTPQVHAAGVNVHCGLSAQGWDLYNP